jgi:hypothetical protein
MVTTGPQKGFFPEADLPALSLFKDYSFGYEVRYRVVSEDSNTFSHYSPFHTVKPNYIFERPEGRALDEISVARPTRSPYVNIAWPSISILDRVSRSLIKVADQYDVWLRWDVDEANANWVKAERVNGNQVGLVLPKSYDLVISGGAFVNVASTPTRLSVEIYIRANPQSRGGSSLLVYKLDNEDISDPSQPPPN